MTVTAHALVGGAIAAATVQNPVLGATLSLVSHPILDIIPHWDEGWGWRQKPKLLFFAQASFDLTLGLLLSFLFFSQNIPLWYFGLCVLLSIAPDLFLVPYQFMGWKFPPFSTAYQIQHKLQGKAKLPWGILTQVVTVAFIILFLQAYHF